MEEGTKDKSKYYTPKIEEFRVGFEFEVRGRNYDINTVIIPEELKGVEITDWLINTDAPYQDLGWAPRTFTIGGTLSIEVISSCLSRGEIRVKHLGKEDIESFGLVQDHNHNDVRFSYTNGSVRVEHTPHRNRISVYEWGAEQDTVARITIKNKSELGVLLKDQLGVL